MTYVLVGEEDRSMEAAAGIDSSVVDLPPRSGGGGHYRPASAVSAATALQWVAYDEALSALRALLCVSHEDLRHNAQSLSRTFGATFFGAAAAVVAPPIAAGGARFPEGGLFVCADLPPLAPALRNVQRALVQVSVTDASHGPCHWYFDTVGYAMHLLVGDAGDGGVTCGSVVFRREKFESAFALEWVDA